MHVSDDNRAEEVICCIYVKLKKGNRFISVIVINHFC